MKKNKDIIIAIILVIILLIILYLNYFKKDNNGLIENENIVINSKESLSKVSNELSFRYYSYSLDEERIKDESIYLINLISTIVNADAPVLYIKDLDMKEVEYYVNLLTIGDGVKSCYDKDYFEELVYYYFGIEDNLEEDICFDEVFLNYELSGEIISFDKVDNSYVVKILYDESNYYFTYDNNYHLISVVYKEE